jgi:hypothetical protein
MNSPKFRVGDRVRSRVYCFNGPQKINSVIMLGWNATDYREYKYFVTDDKTFGSYHSEDQIELDPIEHSPLGLALR